MNAIKSEAGFKAWMEKVDAEVWAAADVSAHDLPDMNYLDWYEDGMSPKRAARIAIKRNADDDRY